MGKTLKRYRAATFEENISLPVNMIVEVTNACNHACIFCAHDKMKRKVGMLDMDLYRSVAKQAYEGGTREIGFYMTGEPLMNNRLIDYVSYAGELGFEYIYITTNGALATPDKMKDLIKAGLNSIKFSINAGTAETYKLIHGRDDFDKVIANLKALSEYVRSEKPDVGLFVTCIACKQNQNELQLLKELVGPYVDDVTMPEAYNQGGNMYEIKDGIMLDPDYKPMKAPCSMLFNRLHVTCEGYLNACCVDFENDLVVADLHEMSLLEAWNSVKMRNLRKMHLNKDIPKGVMCYNCIHNENEEIQPL